MVTIGTSTGNSATKILLLGSGELGKEVAIEAQRLGIYVIAVDRYADAPAMQIAHESHVIDMLDSKALEALLRKTKPDFIVPEIEAIATDNLVKMEKEGFHVVPNALATKLTMDREGIRRFAHEELGLRTSPYAFADTKEDYLSAIDTIGIPCVVKPVMSSSGKGQSIIRSKEDSEKAWEYAQSGGRAGAGRVIIEQFIEFDYEITLLTVRHKEGTSFLEPIGHWQEDGDYRESWQPQPMDRHVLAEARRIAKTVTDGIGGYGIFGVELFIKEDNVYFSEVSPRPHDTGMVTLISQDMSEFELHVRAFLRLPIPRIQHYGPSASAALLVEGDSSDIEYQELDKALARDKSSLKLFGKPSVKGRRRMGVALALGDSIEEARSKACQVRDAVKVECK
jgi:phosphoribosylglycinamide formyltransferase 2